MKVTASKLRENIYQILDDAIATGTPIEIERKGVSLQIVPQTQPPKLSRLTKRDAFVGDSEDIIGMDWLSEWTALK